MKTVPVEKSFLCLRVKTKEEKKGADMIIDVNGEINLFISPVNSTPTVKLLSIFELLTSRGVQVLFYGHHLGPADFTHVIRDGVLFQLEEFKKGKGRIKKSSWPAFMEIYIL
jgi:hypothetical protein